MSCAQLSHSLTRHVVRHGPALLLACAALLAAPAAFALDAGDIIIVSSKGEVHITMNGAERNLRAGQALELPATVRTGRDGNIEIRQGATSVSVGPETLLDFPALEKRGAPIDRIQQPRGNVFYNIGKREGRKLRVETPYLVAVIKGTQFNVAALDEATTISLFEGRLEVHASDDSDVVDLKAGEIASRRRGDASIGTIRMESGKAPVVPRAPGSGSSNGTPGPVNPLVAPSDEGNETLLVDRVVNNTPVDLGVGTDLRGTGTSDTGAPVAPAVGVGNEVDPSSPDVSIDAGDVIGVDNNVEVAATPAVIAGPSGTDVIVIADSGAATAVDVPASVTVDAGPVNVGVDTSTSVDLGAGAVDAGVTVGASAPPVEVNVVADATVDVGTGTVNVGVDVGGANLDLGVDLGLDDDNSGPGNGDDGNNGHGNDDDHSDSSNPGSGNSGHGSDAPLVDVGGLLDGLTRRANKK